MTENDLAWARRLSMSTAQYLQSIMPEGKPRSQPTIGELAQSYLDRADEDYTWVNPEDIKRLARAVLSK